MTYDDFFFIEKGKIKTYLNLNSCVKNDAMKTALDAWPDGKEYLSGPKSNSFELDSSELVELFFFGLDLLKICLRVATVTMSRINPYKKFVACSANSDRP